jgi:hypothetical protein
MKLKLFTDLSLLTFGTTVDLLIPFVGIGNEEYSEGRLYAHTFDEYCAHANEYIELTSIEECDACLLPIVYKPSWSNGNAPADVQLFLDTVKHSEKNILVFLGHDIYMPKVDISNAIIFSGAIDKSKQGKEAHSYPHFFLDLLSYNETTFSPRQKGNIPVVGFCGYAPPLGIKFSKEKVIGFLKLVANYAGLMKFFPSKISHSYRTRAIIALQKSSKVKPNLRIKNTFAFGPNGQLNGGNSGETDVEFRRNFINNILESDYTLCVRGIGNNSIRFFETLCCGRIPVFVNTDSVLPFDHLIDWKKRCVWVEEKDIDNISEVVSEFHQRISETDFIELQKELRQIWVDYFSPLGFHKHLSIFVSPNASSLH